MASPDSPSPRTDPLTPEEEAKFRLSVEMLGDGGDYAPLQWSNTTAIRLLATLDAARAAQEAPAPEGLDREFGLRRDVLSFALWQEFGGGQLDEDDDNPPTALPPTHDYWFDAADRVLATAAKIAANVELTVARPPTQTACPLCTVGIAQQEPDLHLTNDCGCECHAARGGSR